MLTDIFADGIRYFSTLNWSPEMLTLPLGTLLNKTRDYGGQNINNGKDEQAKKEEKETSKEEKI